MFGEELSRVRTRYGQFHIAKRDSVIGLSLQRYGEWGEHEISVLSEFVEEGDGFIIDVGANIGTHAAGFAARFSAMTVIACEPNPLAYCLLVTNMVVNGYSNVQPLQIACGARSKIIRVPLASDGSDEERWNLGAASFLENSQGTRSASKQTATVPVSVVALDSLVIAKRVKLIKIDVEGAESAVLAGARSLISRDRPVIFFEVLSMENMRSCRTVLDSLDYKLSWLETTQFNENNYNGFDVNLWSKTEMGVIAVPNERKQAIPLPPVKDSEDQIPYMHGKNARWNELVGDGFTITSDLDVDCATDD